MVTRTLAAPTLADAERAAAALAGAGAGRVVLFGSVARGEATERSDIDLVAIFDDLDYGERWERRCELMSLAGRVVEFSVDVSVTDRAEWAMRTSRVLTSFEGRAARDGVVLVDRPAVVDVDWSKQMVMPDSDCEEAFYRLETARDALGSLLHHLSPTRIEMDPHDARAYVQLLARLRHGCGHAHRTVESAVESLIHLQSDPDGPAWGHDIGRLCARLAEPHRSDLQSLMEPLGAEKITPWHIRAVYHWAGQEPDADPELLADLARTACRVASYAAAQFLAHDHRAAAVSAYVEDIEAYLDSCDLVTGEER